MSVSVDGKRAERAVQEWLTERSARDVRFAFHRYPDSHAARGILSAQPADYLVARWATFDRSEATNLEVKETSEVTRLPRAKITQYGKLKMFDMAGFRTVVIVYLSAKKMWTYFERDTLFPNTEQTPTSFPFEGRPLYPTAAEALQYIFS